MQNKHRFPWFGGKRKVAEEEEEEEILKLKRREVMKKNDRVAHQMGRALDRLADRVPYGNILLACGGDYLTADFLEEAANRIDSLQKEIDKLKGVMRNE